MKSILFIVLSGLIVASCNNSEKNTAVIQSFDKEIENRRAILNRLNMYDDSLAIISQAIHKEVQNLILLSKDVENLPACVNKGNQFFSKMAERYTLSPAHYTVLKHYMFPYELEVALKQNELAVYNQIIFNNGASEIQLFSAGEMVRG